MLDDATVEDLRRHWDEGWNAGDLDTIMAPFAADVIFSSPFVPRLTGDPEKTTIGGYDALRPSVYYWPPPPPRTRDALHAPYPGPHTLRPPHHCPPPPR